MTRKHLLGINEVMYSNLGIGCLRWHSKFNFIINSQPMIEDLNSCTCIVYPEKKLSNSELQRVLWAVPWERCLAVYFLVH